MPPRTPRIAILALLVAVVFLGAQFHFCADLTGDSATSHFCPVCSATTAAMATEAPQPAMAVISARLTMAVAPLTISADIPRAISPRAPPARSSSAR